MDNTQIHQRVQLKVRRVIKANETQAAKNHRLLVALVRGFAKENPIEAVQIVREVTGQNIALT